MVDVLCMYIIGVCVGKLHRESFFQGPGLMRQIAHAARYLPQDSSLHVSYWLLVLGSPQK